MLLVDIDRLDRLANLKDATVGLLQSHNQAEKSRLAGAVGANDAHDAVGRQHEVQVVKQQLVAEGLGYMLGLDDLVAQAGAVGDEDFELFLFLLDRLVQQFVVAVQARLSFGLSGFGGHSHPFQLALQGLLALALGLLFLGQALGFLLKPAAVVAFPGDALAAVEFQDPAGHVVEEVAVVGHGDDRALVLLQVLLQPVDGLGVQVVGGLVEQQDVGLLQQQAAQGHTAPLTTAQVLGQLVAFGAAQGIHRTLQAVVQVPGIGGVDDVLQLGLTGKQFVHLLGILVVFGQAELEVDFLEFLERVHHVLHAFLHHFLDRLGRVELRILGQVAHSVSGSEHHLALVLRFQTGDNLHQRGFTRAVEADDADFGAIVEREVDVLEDLLLVLLDGLAHAHHREDDFLVVNCCHDKIVFLLLLAKVVDSYRFCNRAAGKCVQGRALYFLNRRLCHRSCEPVARSG